ncbi:MAG TPA: hypothetical protein DIT13_00485 [Verrucomicrobiales bacterium]|nr:hypothetical protein [Verrucomicrobiales bacterium]
MAQRAHGAGDARMIPGPPGVMTKLLTTRWLWWAGILLWAGLLWWLSSRSALPSGPEFPFKDKVLHCAYFSGGAFCLATALFAARLESPPSWAWLLAGFIFTALTGALDELHQSFTPGRMGNDPGDWLADVCGGVLGGWLAWRARRMCPDQPSFNPMAK